MKKRLFSAGIVSIIAMSTFAGAVSADSDRNKSTNVSLSVESGEFKVDVPELSGFGELEIGSKLEASSAFSGDIAVTDYSGKLEGWDLTVRADKLKNNAQNHTLDKDALTINESKTIRKNSGDSSSNVGTITKGSGVISDSPRSIAKAEPGNNGTGKVFIEMPDKAIDINLESENLRHGTYETTLEWNLSTGP